MPFLKQALEDCAQTEYAFKSGKLGERMSVELLIVEYSSRNRNRTL